MKKFLKQLRKDERGLTLVELLAVVVILGIIATIAFVSIGNVIENSKKDAHISNAMQLISAAKLAEASASGEYPTEGYTTGPVNENQKELDTIEDLNNPWNTNPVEGDAPYIGTVTKEGDIYSVSISGEDINTDVDISGGVEESVINQGRDAVENRD